MNSIGLIKSLLDDVKFENAFLNRRIRSQDWIMGEQNRIIDRQKQLIKDYEEMARKIDSINNKTNVYI